MTYRIALADDQPQVLESIRRILTGEPDLEVVAEALDGVVLFELLRSAPEVADLIITDITMPNMGGIDVVRQAKILYPETKVLILTMHEEEEYLAQAMSAGAAGYLLKDDAGGELIQAIRLIRAGGTYVSPLFRPQFNTGIRSEQPDTAPPGEDKLRVHIANGTKKPDEDSGSTAPQHKPSR